MAETAFPYPHRRYNPLRRQWVLVSPHRTQRPWQGEVNQVSGFSDVRYDPACYLCPGNERAGGARTPAYEHVYVFDNDYAALLPDSPAPESEGRPALLRAERERGVCRVICFDPDHSLTLSRMPAASLRRVVDAWVTQYGYLGRMADINHVQIFDNRGTIMGTSNPHPHGQIWATEHVPDEPAQEQAALLEYRERHGSCLLCDYIAVEREAAARGEGRLVCENDGFLTVVPWWAVWPFETLVLAKRHVRSLADFDDNQRSQFADILKQTTTRYDNLFQTSFPYTMGFHQSPTDGDAHPEWHFHAHYYPPLLRSATVRKFMVGFEMLGMPQRDITPESAAERLRAVSIVHFMEAQRYA
jgi:UDPglucose--hexose-1-phosphate uridylyltransferase